MALLNDEIRGQVAEMLADLPNQVKLITFTQPEDCPYCELIVELMQEVASTSPQVTSEVYDFTVHKDKVAEYKIDKAPATAIVGAKDYGLRFFGIPANYEFGTLLHSIRLAGHGHALELDEASKSFLASLEKPVHIQVFVTPTCPYCPRAATLAFEMATASDLVRADVIEAQEFMELSNAYNVMGVPLNVINDKERVEGAAPAYMIVEAIKKSI